MGVTKEKAEGEKKTRSNRAVRSGRLDGGFFRQRDEVNGHGLARCEGADESIALGAYT